MAALPPGPRMSRAAQTAAWTVRPGPFMQRARREFGDTFTIKVGTEPPWVMLAHPDAVHEVFTGDPDVLHAGKANLILRPMLGRSSVLLLDGRQRPERIERAGFVPARAQPGRRAAVRADPRAPGRPRRGRALAAARSPRRGRRRDERPRAARRARHALVAGHETTATALSVGDRAARPHARRVGGPAGGRRGLRGGRRQGGAAAAAGTVVAPAIYLVHRRPEIYPDPARLRRPRRTPRPREPAAGRSRWCRRAGPRSS